MSQNSKLDNIHEMARTLAMCGLDAFEKKYPRVGFFTDLKELPEQTEKDITLVFEDLPDLYFLNYLPIIIEETEEVDVVEEGFEKPFCINDSNRTQDTVPLEVSEGTLEDNPNKDTSCCFPLLSLFPKSERRDNPFFTTDQEGIGVGVKQEWCCKKGPV